jgi:hypothetical protein
MLESLAEKEYLCNGNDASLDRTSSHVTLPCQPNLNNSVAL